MKKQEKYNIVIGSGSTVIAFLVIFSFLVGIWLLVISIQQNLLWKFVLSLVCFFVFKFSIKAFNWLEDLHDA